MTKLDARKEQFEQVEVLGKSVLFTDLRVDRATVSEGLRCYELRHTDEDWDEPCELARGILVNFMGTILTSDPYQLPPEGWLQVNESSFSYTDKPSLTASEYLTEHPPTGKEVIDLYTIAEDKHDLLFSKDDAADLKNGCIGHLRGDFGSGKQFYTTWWPHQGNRLNTESFKADIDRVVNWLRGETGPLHDFSTMEQFCRMHENSAAVHEAMMIFGTAQPQISWISASMSCRSQSGSDMKVRTLRSNSTATQSRLPRWKWLTRWIKC